MADTIYSIPESARVLAKFTTRLTTHQNLIEVQIVHTPNYIEADLLLAQSHEPPLTCCSFPGH